MEEKNITGKKRSDDSAGFECCRRFHQLEYVTAATLSRTEIGVINLDG
jgi:hypothetical protein